MTRHKLPSMSCRAIILCSNRVAAAECLFESRRFKLLGDFSQREAVRLVMRQAMTTLGGQTLPGLTRDQIDGQKKGQWAKVAKHVRDRGIRWNAKREEFVANGVKDD
jgi:hypothetical protein